MVKSLLLNEVEVNVAGDDIRLGSNLTTNTILKLTEKSSFLHHFGFCSMALMYSEQSSKTIHQKIAGTYKSGKPINITGTHKTHFKCD